MRDRRHLLITILIISSFAFTTLPTAQATDVSAAVKTGVPSPCSSHGLGGYEANLVDWGWPSQPGIALVHVAGPTDIIATSINGHMRYGYEIWDCRPVGSTGSGAFVVYKFGAGFHDSVFNFRDAYTPRDTPDVTWIGYHTFSKPEAEEAAALYAKQWPTYESHKGYASFASYDFAGKVEVSSGAGNLGTKMTFDGCGTGFTCMRADAVWV